MFSDFVIPLIHVLNSGNSAIDDPFNYFFSLGFSLGLLLFIPTAILRMLGK